MHHYRQIILSMNLLYDIIFDNLRRKLSEEERAKELLAPLEMGML